MTRGRYIGLFIAIALFALPWCVQFPGLSVQGHRILGVFLAAIVLWITEAVPLFATAVIIILLEILLISDQALLALPEGFSAPSYRVFFGTLADPVLMLFLGGFFLAHGAAKFALDRNLARVLLRPFGTSARMILLGLIGITAVFSMFMSNTATTATMMAVVLPVMSQLPARDRMRTGLALCIPIAANVGGMGTPIGTPPNAIAIGALARAGHTVGFVQWMLMAIPFVLVILLFVWLLIGRLCGFGGKTIKLSIDSTFDTSRSAKIFYVTFAATIAFWLTEHLHGLSSSIVGFFPVVVLLSTRVFSSKDLQALQWHVLWLVAGGIALGLGVGRSGLDVWLLGLIQWQNMSSALIIAMLSLVALALSTVISNSATANLLVPLAMSLAASTGVTMNPVVAAVFVAIGSSLAMALPISTPPNAIAMSTGAVRTKDMALLGLLVGGFGWALFLLCAPRLWGMLGVLPS
ncbi:MAG: DASS family sodium-coupled anion symporter [Planctomycetes bacterium]|nr:DASS family sodium-coupled anion symporter [Planctomycetota bacterium]